MKITSPTDLPNYGFFIGEPWEINFAFWDKNRRRTQRKTHIYAATLNEDFFAAIAVVDAGYLGTAFAYIYQRKTNVFLEEKITQLWAFPENFNPSLKTRWYLGEANRRWEIVPGIHNLLCLFEGPKFKFSLLLETSQPGLNALCPVADRPFNYTFKNLAIPVTAKVEVSNQKWEHQGSSGCLDFSAGYPPRKTYWNWANLLGFTPQKEAVGLNLVAHYNDSLENALCFQGKIIPAGKAFFHYQKPIAKNPTYVKAPDIGLEVTFIPQGSRQENINALLVASHFVQPFGSFEGHVNYQGTVHNIKGVGVVEEHQAIW